MIRWLLRHSQAFQSLVVQLLRLFSFVLCSVCCTAFTFQSTWVDTVCHPHTQLLPGRLYQCPVIKLSSFNFLATPILLKQSALNKGSNRNAISKWNKKGVETRPKCGELAGIDKGEEDWFVPKIKFIGVMVLCWYRVEIVFTLKLHSKANS